MTDPAAIKSSIERSIKAMRLRPSLARARHIGAAVVARDGLGCRFDDGKHAIRMDVPAAVGGDDSAPSPGALSRAALAGCVAIGIKMFASLREVVIGEIVVGLEVEADNRADFGVDGVPPGYESFHLDIRVESTADPNDVRAVIQESLDHSPILDLHRREQVLAAHVQVVAPADLPREV